MISRRELLKKSTLFLGGTLLLPDIVKAWESLAIENKDFLMGDLQGQLIAEIAELIIPTTDTPGAKAADVPLFIKKILADCYSAENRKAFFEGLDYFEKVVVAQTGKSFLELSPDIQVSFLKAAQNEYFFKTLKDLTISGYFSSEIGATQALRYEEIPGRYDGDLPYKKGDKAWG